jgi:hypothetical protein
VGYNPLRKYRGTRAVDISILVGMSSIILALVIWATRS